MLTKQQFLLLEDFGLRRLEDSTINVEELRRAIHQAVLVIPFKDVEGFGEYTD